MLKESSFNVCRIILLPPALIIILIRNSTIKYDSFYKTFKIIFILTFEIDNTLCLLSHDSDKTLGIAWSTPYLFRISFVFPSYPIYEATTKILRRSYLETAKMTRILLKSCQNIHRIMTG